MFGATRKSDKDAGNVPIPECIPPEIAERYSLDTSFYKKHTSYESYAILASAKVSDEALREARHLIASLLANRDDITQALVDSGCRFMIMAPDEKTTDVPEQRSWEKIWDTRARGMGGILASCGEENLLRKPGDPYWAESILVHELSHAVMDFALRRLDPGFERSIKECYDRAMAKGLWKGTYLEENFREYWAEGVQAYFDCMRPHYGANTREKLLAYDPELHAIVAGVFRNPDYRYKPYQQPLGVG